MGFVGYSSSNCRKVISLICIFSFAPTAHTFNTRHRKSIFAFKVETKIGSQAISASASGIYNSLPYEI